MENHDVSTHPLRCRGTRDQTPFTRLNNLLLACKVNEVAAMNAEQNIVSFGFRTELLGGLLLHLRRLPPTRGLILKSVQTFFPQENGNVGQFSSQRSEQRGNPSGTATRAS